MHAYLSDLSTVDVDIDNHHDEQGTNLRAIPTVHRNAELQKTI